MLPLENNDLWSPGNLRWFKTRGAGEKRTPARAKFAAAPRPTQSKALNSEASRAEGKETRKQRAEL